MMIKLLKKRNPLVREDQRCTFQSKLRPAIKAIIVTRYRTKKLKRIAALQEDQECNLLPE